MLKYTINLIEKCQIENICKNSQMIVFMGFMTKCIFFMLLVCLCAIVWNKFVA